MKAFPLIFVLALGSPAFAQEAAELPPEAAADGFGEIPDASASAQTPPLDTGRSIADDKNWLEGPEPPADRAFQADTDRLLPDDPSDRAVPPASESAELVGPELPPAPPAEIDEDLSGR